MRIIPSCSWALAALLLVHCKGKDGAPGPKGDPGASGATATNTITDHLQLFNEFGVSQSNHSGANVTLLGSHPERNTTTDSTGKFTFANVPVGTYDLLIQKEGYPDYKHYGYPVLPGPKSVQNHTNTPIQQSSSTVVTKLSLLYEKDYNNNPNVCLKAKIAQRATEAEPRAVLCVCSNSPTVSMKDVGTYSFSYNNPVEVVYMEATGDSAKTWIGNFNGRFIMESGKTVYCKAYGIGFGVYNDYYDPELDRKVYPTLSPVSSKVASVKIP